MMTGQPCQQCTSNMNSGEPDSEPRTSLPESSQSPQQTQALNSTITQPPPEPLPSPSLTESPTPTPTQLPTPQGHENSLQTLSSPSGIVIDQTPPATNASPALQVPSQTVFSLDPYTNVINQDANASKEDSWQLLTGLTNMTPTEQANLDKGDNIYGMHL